MIKSRLKKIVFTGGGTAGHVFPNLAVIAHLKNIDVFYFGSSGIEKKILADYPQISFREIPAGKLRRYFSLENILDLFKVAWSFFVCLYHLKKLSPALVFSKGGYVSVPVCLAAKCLGIPILTHESDLSPGLATKIIAPLADLILTSFEETLSYLPAKTKKKQVGSLVRNDLFQGDKVKGLSFLNYNGSKPVLLIMGGSLGAGFLNKLIFDHKKFLLENYFLVHLCGKGGLANPELKECEKFSRDYRAYEFLSDELADVYACTDLVISRSGANALFEFASLQLPALLVPLEQGSRGDQLENARSFANLFYAKILREKQAKEFPKHFKDFIKEADFIKKKLGSVSFKDGARDLAKMIEKNYLNKRDL